MLQLKSAWRDGTTHIKMLPLEFMQRLAALVPRPRLHLIRFHGVLAPNAGLRAAVVPGPPEKPGDDPAHDAHEAPARMSWVRLHKRVFGIDLEHCPQFGNELKIIAAIEEPAVIVRILTHLGLPARAPPRSPARLRDLFQAARSSRQERFCSGADDPTRPALAHGGQCASKSALMGRPRDRQTRVRRDLLQYTAQINRFLTWWG